MFDLTILVASMLILCPGRVFGVLWPQRAKRMSFFLLSAVWGKILIIDNLIKRGYHK